MTNYNTIMVDVQERLSQLEERVKTIETRNSRVEKDKAWELSTFRKLLVAVLTYLTMVVVFYSLNSSEPWQNALIPTLGFLLSTFSFDMVRQIWMDKNH
jgi:hypothetical protein